jgi:hypothetical protein
MWLMMEILISTVEGLHNSEILMLPLEGLHVKYVVQRGIWAPTQILI